MPSSSFHSLRLLLVGQERSFEMEIEPERRAEVIAGTERLERRVVEDFSGLRVQMVQFESGIRQDLAQLGAGLREEMAAFAPASAKRWRLSVRASAKRWRPWAQVCETRSP